MCSDSFVPLLIVGLKLQPALIQVCCTPEARHSTTDQPQVTQQTQTQQSVPPLGPPSQGQPKETGM